MTQALIDNLPLIAAAPDGIKALRGLILDLAVRGKLVPQDPKDEPASELLKRVESDKRRLGSYERLPNVGSEEQLLREPVGWVWTRYGNWAVEVATGPFGSMLHQSDYVVGGVPIVNPSHMIDGSVVPEKNKTISASKAEKLSSYRLSVGDIVMARRGEVGRAALVRENQAGYICGTGSFVVRFSNDCVRDFVLILLKSRLVRSYLLETSVGATMTNLNHGILKRMPVLVPPLAEQRRIVAKVDELMALCDRLEAQQADAEAVHAALVKTLLDTLIQSQDADDFAANWQRLSQHFPRIFTTEASVDALKQAILQMAVRGKLVRQDRNDQPVENLLARANVSMPVDEAFEVPSSWRWVCCGAVAEARLGKMLDKNKNRGTPQLYLRNLNVRWFDFDLSDLLKMKIEDSELSEFELTSGDVLVCEGGEPGRAAVWGQNGSGIYFQKALHRVRFCDLVNPHYFVKALRASADDGRLSKYFTGAGIQHFTGKSLEKYAFPLPPLAEQHRIVAKVDELFALCDSLKAQIAESRAVQRQLATALVEQAVAA